MQKTLQAASKAKSDFLLAMSHNLRTPLYGLMGMLEIAGDVIDDVPMRRQLNHMIATALRFAELDDLGRTSQKAEFTLGALSDKFIAEFCEACLRYGVALSVLVEGGPTDARRKLRGEQAVLEETTVLVLRYFLRSAPPKRIAVTLGVETETGGQLMLKVIGTDAQGSLGSRAVDIPGLADATGINSPEVIDLSLAVAHRLTQLTGATSRSRTEPGVGSDFEYRIPVENG